MCGMQVVILCGGLGTRLAEETDVRPKPMVEIGGKPILWHIMKIYSSFGLFDFILCLGYKGDMIRDYFLNYGTMNSDVRVSVGDRKVDYLEPFHDEAKWRVVLAETGPSTPTGGRIHRITRYLDGPEFMVTYGDGLANIDIDALLRFHRSHGKIATVTGVRPAGRFGELTLRGDLVAEFREKPQLHEGWINGGFFVFNKEATSFISPDSVLERQPLERLAADGQLAVYRHEGYWRPMDTMRERRALEEEWANGKPPWKRW
jgi:glucose-1-phosphate cytidylyltransferase